MSFSRCPRSQIAAHFALTAIFMAAPAFGQSDRALSHDESLQLATALSSQVTSTGAQARASREMAVSAAQMMGGMTTAPRLSMFVFPAAYLLMRRTRSARCASQSSRRESFVNQTERRNEMKRYAIVFAVVALSIAAISASWAQSGGMGGMDMKNMNMMGKDKKGKASEKVSQARLHKGVGTVTNMDTVNGKVTIAHGPIQTMKWSAMSMTFGVKDKKLLEKLSTGKKVEFEFIQRGSGYIIISAK